MNCPICNNEPRFLCEKRDRFNALYKYMICQNCRFMFEGSLVLDDQFLQQRVSELYKSDYFEKTDVGWQMRGDGFLRIIRIIIKMYNFFNIKKNTVILDYGGGNGYLASKLAENYDVLYYDKYEKPSIPGRYKILINPTTVNIIYAVELVEHITDIKEWDFLKNLLPNIFVFTTGLSDNIKEKDLHSWVYLNPNAGHTAIYSFRSLYILGKKYGFVYFFFPNISCHVFLRNKFLSKINFVSIEYFFYNIFRHIKKVFS